MMKEMILSNWSFMRVLRLLLGIAVVVQTAATKDWLMLIAGVLLTATALLNIGCCGSQGCATPVRRKINAEKEVEYEEVGS